MGILSNTSTYAIRAALYVASARLAAGDFMSTRRIAEDLDVPFPFLAKVLKEMVQAGILGSQRGPAGGVSLARPASQITLLDIVRSVHGDEIFASCVLGLPACDNEHPCALHEPWRVQRAQLESLFVKTTLADLVERAADDDAPLRAPGRSGDGRGRRRNP